MKVIFSKERNREEESSNGVLERSMTEIGIKIKCTVLVFFTRKKEISPR